MDNINISNDNQQTNSAVVDLGKKAPKPRVKKENLKAEISDKSKVILEFLSGREPHELDAIRAVVNLAISKDNAESISLQERKFINFFLNEGILNNNDITEAVVRNHRHIQAQKLLKAVIAFLNKDCFCKASLLVINITHSREGVDECLKWAYSKTASSKAESSSSKVERPSDEERFF